MHKRERHLRNWWQMNRAGALHDQSEPLEYKLQDKRMGILSQEFCSF
jgi:hypothetical protein